MEYSMHSSKTKPNKNLMENVPRIYPPTLHQTRVLIHSLCMWRTALHPGLTKATLVVLKPY